MGQMGRLGRFRDVLRRDGGGAVADAKVHRPAPEPTGEYLTLFSMVPSSQGLEPPENPGRFNGRFLEEEGLPKVGHQRLKKELGDAGFRHQRTRSGGWYLGLEVAPQGARHVLSAQ